MTFTLVGIPVVSAGDVDTGAVNLTRWLDAGETISGTPTVAEQTTAHLTIGSVAANVAAIVVKGKTAAIGKAVQFSVSGQTAGTTYSLLVTWSTTASRTKKVIVKFRAAS